MVRRYREGRYIAGRYMDVALYPVFPSARRRKNKFRPSTEGQRRLNAVNAENRLLRLLHANFTEADLEIHLTYAEDRLPRGEDEIRRDLQNWIRRVKRLYAAQGLPLKYIAVTERGQQSGRVHFHVTLSGGVDRDRLEKLWGRGYANSRRLQFDDNEGLRRLCGYIFARDRKDSGVWKKRWNASKNLVQPEYRQATGRVSARRMERIFFSADAAELERLYPGYRVTGVRFVYNDINDGFYIHARFVAEPGKRVKRKRREAEQ